MSIKYENLCDSNRQIEEYEKYKKISLNTISENCNKDEERRISIDDKAKSNLFVISIVTALLFSGLTNILQQDTAKFLGLDNRDLLTLRYSLFLFVFIGIYYFVLCGFFSVKTLFIQEFFRITIDEKADILNSKRNSRESMEIMKHRYMLISKLNSLKIVKKINLLDSSYYAFRNAIISIFLSFIAILILVCINL